MLKCLVCPKIFERKRNRSDVVKYMGRDTIKRIYKYADVFHCEPI